MICLSYTTGWTMVARVVMHYMCYYTIYHYMYSNALSIVHNSVPLYSLLIIAVRAAATHLFLLCAMLDVTTFFFFSFFAALSWNRFISANASMQSSLQIELCGIEASCAASRLVAAKAADSGLALTARTCMPH